MKEEGNRGIERYKAKNKFGVGKKEQGLQKIRMNTSRLVFIRG